MVLDGLSSNYAAIESILVNTTWADSAEQLFPRLEYSPPGAQ